MAHSKTLQQQVDELRGELAALQAERARETAAPKSRKSAPAGEADAEVASAAEAMFETAREAAEDAMSAASGAAANTLGDVEKALAGFLELTETEIAEHPTLAAGLAFLAGVAVGRMSKG